MINDNNITDNQLWQMLNPDVDTNVASKKTLDNLANVGFTRKQAEEIAVHGAVDTALSFAPGASRAELTDFVSELALQNSGDYSTDERYEVHTNTSMADRFLANAKSYVQRCIDDMKEGVRGKRFDKAAYAAVKVGAVVGGVVTVGYLLFGKGGVQTANADMVLDVDFTNSLSGGYISDTFNAGTDTTATDGYELTHDVKQPGAVGKYTQMRTYVDGEALTKDFREGLENNVAKTWQVKLLVQGIEEEDAVDETGTIKWDYTGVPSDIKLTFIDYGTDSSRTTPVATIDMRADIDNIYTFDVLREGPGTYGYVDFTAELVPEPATLALKSTYP